MGNASCQKVRHDETTMAIVQVIALCRDSVGIVIKFGVPEIFTKEQFPKPQVEISVNSYRHHERVNKVTTVFDIRCRQASQLYLSWLIYKIKSKADSLRVLFLKIKRLINFGTSNI